MAHLLVCLSREYLTIMIKQLIADAIDQAPSDVLPSNPLSVAFILFSLVVIYAASSFPSEGLIGPGFFPILTSIGIILFAVVDILSGKKTELTLTNLDFGPPVVVLILLVVYILLMPVLGFLVDSMILLPVLLYYSNVRSKSVIVGLSVGLPILLFYVFVRIFFVRLPEGIVPISRLLPQLPLVVMF